MRIELTNEVVKAITMTCPYLNTDLRNCKEIGKKEQLMNEQLYAMDNYRAVLAHRILMEMGVKDE